MNRRISLTTVFLLLCCAGLRAGEMALEQRLGELAKEIAPDNTCVRPPYDLPRHDMGLDSQAKHPDKLREQTLQRQLALEARWLEIKGAAANANLEPLSAFRLAFLSYAFGEGKLEDALRTAKAAGRTEQLRLARLLLLECAFDDAVTQLMELATGEDEVATQALALLVRHAEERRALAQRVAVLPLSADLNGFLDQQKGARATLIAALRKAIMPRLSPDARALSVRTTDVVLPPEALTEVFDIVVPPETPDLKHTLAPESWRWAYLETDSTDLLLHENNADAARTGQAIRTFTVTTAYCGALTLALYYFDSQEAWQTIDAPKLAALKPERTWQETFHPLRDNNLVTSSKADVTVRDLREGYYLLAVSARYAPMLCAHKFVVTHTALYLRASRNQAVVVAVDRRTGKPVADVPLELALTGSPNDWELHRAASASFRRGFRGETEEAVPPESDAKVLVQRANDYLAGQEARRKYPDLKETLKATTGADGSALFPLDLGRAHYYYHLRAHRLTPSFAEVGCGYHEYSKGESLKTVAWAAQPVYRPGDTLQFKGIVRRFDGERLLPHKKDWKAAVECEVKSEAGTLWKGLCALSAAGTFSGSCQIPQDAKLGLYQLLVDDRVADPYQFVSVEEFRLPTFQVSVNLPRYDYGSGETVSGTVKVEYLTGKPVNDAEVELSFESRAADAPPVTLKTDYRGVASFNFVAPAAGEDRHYTVRATVMDSSGQSFGGFASFSAKAAAFKLETVLTPERPYTGAAMQLSVRALTWDDKPIKDALIVPPSTTRGQKTDAEGRATFKLTAPKYAGYNRLEVLALLNDNVARRDIHLYPIDRPVGARDQVHGDRVKVTAEPAKAGEDLKVALEVDRADGKEALVLLFVENTRMLVQRVLSLPPGTHNFNIPTQLDFTPNVVVRAVLLTGTSKLENTASAYVTPIQQFLTIKLTTDKEQYAPGEPCTAELTVANFEGKPAANVELSLGVVDLAVYFLREDPTPSLQNYFYQYQLPNYGADSFDAPIPAPASVLFWKGPKYAWGYLDVDWGLGFASGSGRGSFGQRNGGGRRLMVKRHGGSLPTESTRLRKDFRNTAHWLAETVTDEAGRARVQFTFPDNVTTWRFTARGITADTLVGEVRHERRTFLPLQVELPLPRALREGDRVKIGSVVHNNTDAQRKLSVEMWQGEAAAAVPVTGKIDLKPQGDARLDMEVSPSGTSELKLQAKVKDDGNADSDAILRPLEVLPRGHPVTKTFGGILGEPVSVPLDLGGVIQPGTLKVKLSLEPGLAGPVEAALDTLIDYPYGCVEQTMSRFMPAVIACRAMQRINCTPKRAAELPVIFSKSLARLADFQHEDGGWGWWKTDTTNDFMTAYVLEGLALCRDAGETVPLGLLDRAERYLFQSVLANRFAGEHGPSAIGCAGGRVYASRALALYYAPGGERFNVQRDRLGAIVDEIARNADKLPARDLALLADALRLLNRAEAARDILDKAFAARSVQKDRGSLLEAAALLEAGVALEPTARRWGVLARELIQRRRGGGWTDTLSTASIIRGLAGLLKPAEAAMPVEVYVDERLVCKLQPKDKERVALTLDRDVVAAREVRLKPERAASDVFWSAQLDGFLMSPPQPPANPVAEIALKVLTTDKEGKEVQAFPSEKETDVVTVKRGTTIKLRLECDLTVALNCLRISLPRPCGLEVVRPPRLREGLVAIEDHDAGIHFFADSWDKGKHAIEFTARAEAAGAVFGPLPQLAPMYDDSVPVRVTAPTSWLVVE